MESPLTFDTSEGFDAGVLVSIAQKGTTWLPRFFRKTEPLLPEERLDSTPLDDRLGLPVSVELPLKPTIHPLRADIPVYLGAEGPKNVANAFRTGVDTRRAARSSRGPWSFAGGGGTMAQ